MNEEEFEKYIMRKFRPNGWFMIRLKAHYIAGYIYGYSRAKLQQLFKK